MLSEKEIFEWIKRGRAGEAVVNILIIRVRFEPQFVGVREEQPAEKEENEHKSEGRFIEGWEIHFQCVFVTPALVCGASIARRVFFPTKQSSHKLEIASGKGQKRPRNDITD